LITLEPIVVSRRVGGAEGRIGGRAGGQGREAWIIAVLNKINRAGTGCTPFPWQ
jgi:hypothetical protein